MTAVANAETDADAATNLVEAFVNLAQNGVTISGTHHDASVLIGSTEGEFHPEILDLAPK